MSWLLVVQLKYNNDEETSTSMFPFKEKYSCPTIMMLGAPIIKVPSADNLISTLKSLHGSLEANMSKVLSV